MGMQYENLRRDNSERFFDSERPPDVPEAEVNAPKVYGNGKKKYKSGDYVKSQEEKLNKPRRWFIRYSSIKNTITPSSAVRVLFEDKNTHIYIIVHSNDADSDLNQISTESPVGSALIGKKVGDTIKINTPSGTVKCEILKIWACYLQNSSKNNFGKNLNYKSKSNQYHKRQWK